MLIAEDVRVDAADGARGTFAILSVPRFAPAAGAVTAVAGPSGSGKSTLLYVLAGLLPPARGRVLCGATDLYTLSESGRDRWRRQNVGFVFQDFHLIPELSVMANATLPATFANGGGRARRRAAELLAALGVPTARRSPQVLSRGERQRLAVARALAHDPPIVLADEPTASLDAATATEVVAILKQLAGEGRTVVVATHDPRGIAAADAVVHLDHGGLVTARAAA